MCGRYALGFDSRDLYTQLKLFNLEIVNGSSGVVSDENDARSVEAGSTESYEANFNVAPTSNGAVYRSDKDGSKLSYMKWGLIPQWVNDLAKFQVSRTFNAREEGLLDSKMWKPCVNYKRCVVPISGYYEWKTSKTGKIPYYVTKNNGELMFLAGLYDYNSVNDVYSYTIITNNAPVELEWLHHRMPVVLEPNTPQWDNWLNYNKHSWSTKELDELLKSTFDSEKLICYQVSKDVGKVANKGSNLIKPILKEDKKKIDSIKQDNSIKQESSIKQEDPNTDRASASDTTKKVKTESIKQEASIKSEPQHNNIQKTTPQGTSRQKRSITDMLRTSTKKAKR